METMFEVYVNDMIKGNGIKVLFKGNTKEVIAFWDKYVVSPEYCDYISGVRNMEGKDMVMTQDERLVEA